MNYKKQKAFTLLELLVVISVTAVLMSVLLPALTGARKQAKGIVCSSNIRQLHIANHAYASENAGRYVLSSSDIWEGNLHRWHGIRKSKNEPFDPSRGPLSAFLGEGEIKRCPAFKTRDYHTQAGQNNANFEAGCGGYGYNDYVGSNTMTGTRAQTRISNVTSPSSTVMFTDTAFRQKTAKGNGVFIEYSFAHPPYWQWYLDMLGKIPAGTNASSIGARPDPTIHFRHGKFTNTAWCDGHISKETMDLSAPYTTHAVMDSKTTAEMSLGWFGPDDNTLFDLK
jgi:prepilin-type N-terminal cleavage/methylation domain-containing protein/prepilin-type processing-associated H-X9-DG protein